MNFQNSQSVSRLDLQASILVIAFPLQMIFAFSYIGQKVHSDLMNLSDMLYQSEWYRYPRSVRRVLLLMMVRAQHPFYLSAYGIMRCTLENFVRVSNWAKRVMEIWDNTNSFNWMSNFRWWTGFTQHSWSCAVCNKRVTCWRMPTTSHVEFRVKSLKVN